MIPRYIAAAVTILSLSCLNIALADTAVLDSTVIKEQRADGSYIWKLSAKNMELQDATINLKESLIEIYGDKGNKTATIESTSGIYDTSSKMITLNNSKIYLLEEKVFITSPYIQINTNNKQLRASNAVITDEHSPNDKLLSKEIISGFNLNFCTHKGFELRAVIE